MHPHQEVGHLIGGLEERPGLHQVFPVLTAKMSRRQIDVAHFDGLSQGGQVQAVARQFRRVRHHPHLAPAPGHHHGAAGVGNGLQAVQQFVGHPPQFVVVGLIAVQGQGDDGHVVDAHGLDHPARHAGRHLIDIGKGLVVDLEEAGLQVLAHLELGGDHGVAVAGLGVEVFQTLHLPELFLQRDDRQVFHLLRRGAGEADEDVHHGHGNLGVFLTGGEDQGRGPGQQADNDNQGGQLGF